MIARLITYFGKPCVVACDANCGKAWGINARPRVDFDPDDFDDYAFLADGKLGEAPVDPGTYEGGHAKPQHADDRLNKWCVRECERSTMSKAGRADETIETRDLSRRDYNQPWKHEDAARRSASPALETGTPTPDPAAGAPTPPSGSTAHGG